MSPPLQPFSELQSESKKTFLTQTCQRMTNALLHLYTSTVLSPRVLWGVKCQKMKLWIFVAILTYHGVVLSVDGRSVFVGLIPHTQHHVRHHFLPSIIYSPSRAINKQTRGLINIYATFCTAFSTHAYVLFQSVVVHHNVPMPKRPRVDNLLFFAKCFHDCFLPIKN